MLWLMWWCCVSYCDVITHVMMSCLILWCYVSCDDIMSHSVMLCLVWWCHVSYCNVMPHVIILYLVWWCHVSYGFDVMSLMVMSCLLWWCHVSFGDVMSYMVMSCLIWWWHVSFGDVMSNIVMCLMVMSCHVMSHGVSCLKWCHTSGWRFPRSSAWTTLWGRTHLETLEGRSRTPPACQMTVGAGQVEWGRLAPPLGPGQRMECVHQSMDAQPVDPRQSWNRWKMVSGQSLSYNNGGWAGWEDDTVIQGLCTIHWYTTVPVFLYSFESFESSTPTFCMLCYITDWL